MRLKELRLQNNLTQTELSDSLSLGRVNYCRYETGQNKPDLETLIKIADYYNVSLDYLCNHKTNQLQLPQLDNNQRTLIETILKLNRDNLSIVYGFTMAIYQKQLA